MLTESALSVFVILATVAGIGLAYTSKNGELLSGLPAWQEHYSSWHAAQGLGSKVQAFVIGSSNMITAIGIPRNIAVVIMGVFVASFAGTSLDTATRLERYFISEIIPEKVPVKFKNRYILSALVVITAALLAYSTGSDGKGALTLWPLFGAINQLLATLALVVLTLYLRQKNNRYWLLTALPALFMSIVTIWAAVLNQLDFFEKNNWLLVVINAVVGILAVGVLLVSLKHFFAGMKRLKK
jgi:carbon starvation protein